jgi:hypothetical protein
LQSRSFPSSSSPQQKNSVEHAIVSPAKTPTITVVLPAVEVFLARDLPDNYRIVWDETCDHLLRRTPPFLKNQSELRAHQLDQQDHSACVVETIPVGSSELLVSGHTGRIARLRYEFQRKTDPETFLRIVAKFPRKKRIAQSTIDGIVRKIVGDPLLKHQLAQGRMSK